MSKNFVNIDDDIILKFYGIDGYHPLEWKAIGGYAGIETHLVKVWRSSNEIINAMVYSIDKRQNVFQYVTCITDEQKILERIGRAIRDDFHI